MKKRDLIKVLVQEGWHFVRSGKHEIWGKGDLTVPVPHGNKIATYTAEQILKKINKTKGKNALKR